LPQVSTVFGDGRRTTTVFNSSTSLEVFAIEQKKELWTISWWNVRFLAVMNRLHT